MSKSVEFFFDFGSPTVYLAATQLPKIAERHGATVLWRPFLLGGVFKATGNVSPATVPAKSRYMGDDLERFAQRYEVPFLFNPFFPVNTLALMRGAVAYQQQGRLDQYSEAIFSAMWVGGGVYCAPRVDGLRTVRRPRAPSKEDNARIPFIISSTSSKWLLKYNIIIIR